MPNANFLFPQEETLESLGVHASLDPGQVVGVLGQEFAPAAGQLHHEVVAQFVMTVLGSWQWIAWRSQATIVISTTSSF